MSKVDLKIKKPEFKLSKLSLPKISLKNIWIILTKEIYNFFTQPIGYIISAIFIIAFVIVTFGLLRYAQFGTNNLTQVFGYTAFLMAIAIPAITMSSISKERQSGTLEYILTRPIREIEYILGKILGNSLIVVVLLLATLPFTLLAAGFTTFDFGQIVMQYLGSIVFGIALVSLGVAVSAGFKNEIGAFLTTIILSAILILFGSELIRLPVVFDPLVSRFSLISHYQTIASGIIDIRDVVYFAAFILTFILIGFYLVKKDKYPKDHPQKTGIRNLVILSVAITLFIGFFGQQLVGRIDLTSGKLFTLSESSVQVINSVKDLVTINVYKSSGLPMEYESEIRSLETLFADYKSYSGGKLEVVYKDPASSSEIESEASTAGLTPINFSTQSSTSAQIVKGYFGAVIKYKEGSNTLNLIDTQNNTLIQNPEYEITRSIRRLTNENLKKVGFVTNNVGASRSSGFSGWDQDLSQLFSVVDLELNANDAIPTDLAAIIIAAPTTKFEEGVISKLKEYYANGGSILLLTNALNIESLDAQPTLNEGSLGDLFADYGITLNNEVVYDLNSYNNVSLQGYLFEIPYPFWINASSTGSEIAAVKGVNQISTLWASSLKLDKKDGNQYWELIKTTSDSNGESPETVSLAFDREYTYKDTDSSRLIAVATENNAKGRAVVVSDWKFIGDVNSLISRADNATFGITSVEWLTKEDGLSSIKAKNRSPLSLIITDSQVPTFILLSFAIPVVLIAAVGGAQYFYRKRLDSVE